MRVEDRINKLVRIKSKTSRKEYLRLDMNENIDSLPEDFVREVLNKITPEDLSIYPEVFPLQDKLALMHNVEKDNILLVNGTDEGIKSIFEVFGQAGKEVVSVYPTFEMYRVYTEMYGMIGKQIEYDEQLHVSSERIVEMITEDTAIVAILNPNNPIGNIFTEEEIKKILDKAKEYQAIVILDEAYYYYYENTMADLVKAYDNAVLLRTFSKLCALAGLRIGYIVGSKEVISYIDKVRPSAGVNAIALKFANELLDRQDIIDIMKETEKEGKLYIKRTLKELNYEYYEGKGNYILFKSKINPNILCERMKEEGILIKVFGVNVLKGYVRITTGSVAKMNTFIEALKKLDC